MKNRIYYILIVIFLALVSCEDDDSNQFVLDEIVFHENADQIGKYLYHSNGLVKRYEFRFDGKLEEYADYLYTGNRLTSRKIYQLTGGNSFQLVRTDKYTYDASGDIEEVIVDKNGLMETVYAFTRHNGKVTRIDYSSSWTGNYHQNYYDVEYDNVGNVSKVTSYNVDDEQPVLNYIVEYEYDDKVNPLLGLAEPNDYLSQNPNNVLKITQRSNEDSEPHTVTDIEYLYNEFGRPQEKVEVIDSHGDISTATIKFLYKRM